MHHVAPEAEGWCSDAQQDSDQHHILQRLASMFPDLGNPIHLDFILNLIDLFD